MSSPIHRRRPARLLAALLLLLVPSCKSATAPVPSIEDGYEAPGSESFGQPILIVPNVVAPGDTINPVVETAASGGYPDRTARHLSTFKSSNGAVMAVNFDGTLTAKRVGVTMITVNLDGLYDSARVSVKLP